jgi:hypothetical protein
MLDVIYRTKNRSKRRPQGPPRTIQEAAEAFIAHVKEMEAGLERALDKKKFDVRYVGDLDNLVPVVKSAIRSASLAMDACASFYRGLLERLIKSQRGASKETIDDIDRDVPEEFGRMIRRLQDYLSIFMCFIATLIGDTPEYHVQRDGDPTKSEINEKLFDATRKLGAVLSYNDVILAYTYPDNETKRENSARLARFVYGCYRRLRDSVVSLSEKYLRATYLYEFYIHCSRAPRQGVHVINYNQEELDPLVKESVRSEFRKHDLTFKAIWNNVRAMEIKAQMNELAARYDTQTSTKSKETADQLAKRAADALGALNHVAKWNVLPFLDDLVRQIDRITQEERKNATESIYQTIRLIEDLTSFMRESAEKLYLKAHQAAEDAARFKAEEARIAEEEERARAAKSSMEDGSDEHEDADPSPIRENEKKFIIIMKGVDDLHERITAIKLYLHDTSTVFGSAFGRYVHRVAKKSARVPYRAWSA